MRRSSQNVNNATSQDAYDGDFGIEVDFGKIEQSAVMEDHLQHLVVDLEDERRSLTLRGYDPQNESDFDGPEAYLAAVKEFEPLTEAEQADVTMRANLFYNREVGRQKRTALILIGGQASSPFYDELAQHYGPVPD